jgi:hypothetical protein
VSTVYVVDRSNNNPPSTVELDAMKEAGIAGVILKATEGAIFVDPDFVSLAAEVHARNMVPGAYGFLHANVAAGPQADLFNRTVAAAGVPVPIRCCDAETADGNVQATVDAFCPAARINLLYSGAAFARADISQPVPGVDWWIAAYGQARPAPPWGTEAGWQFTDASKWGDCSVFDSAIWAALIGATAPSSPDTPEVAMYDPKGHCVALIKPDGSVATFNADGSIGGHYLGGLNNHPTYDAGAGKPEGPAVAITPWDDGLSPWSGYVIWTEDAQGIFHGYSFPSDGRHAAANA